MKKREKIRPWKISTRLRVSIAHWEIVVEKGRGGRSNGGLTFREIQSDEGFTCILPVTVHRKSDRSCAAETTPETDDPEEHRRHDPRVSLGGTPPEAHEADDGGDHDRDGHDEAELRLVDAAVAATHEAHDDIADFPCYGRAEYAAHERGDVDEADAEGVEVVGFLVGVDAGDGFREYDEPADAEGVDEGGPENGGVSEEDERADGDFQPVFVAETAVPGLEGLAERFDRLGAEEGCVAGIAGRRCRLEAGGKGFGPS